MNKDKPLRVLILDDDTLMLEFITELLKELGVQEVLAATDGKVGLFILAAQTTEIDLLICDIDMPRMDGIEFLRKIADQNYRGKIAISSGMNPDLIKATENLAGARQLNIIGAMTKPVTVGAMASLLAQLSTPTQSIAQPDKTGQIFGVAEIEKALTQNLIDIFYQPKISTTSGRITGVECLARWRHAQHGNIAPESFIPIIEQSGLLHDFTQCILRKSVQQLKLWLQQGLDLKISVNISMENLDRFDLPEIYEEMVLACNIPPERVTLELTESKLGKNFAKTLDILTRIRLKGFELSIDDFGTGYSSMETLKQFPFTELKIDRLFAHNVAHDPITRAILESSIKLGRALDLRVVVEGIETKDDYRIAVELGCDEVQGFLIAQPMSADDFVVWLKAHKATHDNHH